MWLTVPIIVVAVAGASYLLALASESFADGLSRAVEAAFDAAEYRLALRHKGRAARAREVGRAGGSVVAARAWVTW